MATQKQPLLPLLNLRNATCAQQYECGVWGSMYGKQQGNGPVSDTFVVDTLKWMVTDKEMFNGAQEPWLYETVGFLMGMVHGGVLSLRQGRCTQR